MDNINRSSVLERAFHKFNKTQVIDFIKSYKKGWVLDKKKKNKKDLKDDFLQMDKFLSEQDVIDLAELTVMKRRRGLPAYTYNFNHLGKLKDKTIEQLKKEFIKPYILSPMHEIVLFDVAVEDGKIILSLKVKEYETFWKTNVQDLGSLTAVYENKVIFENNIKKVSIEAGDDSIEEVIERFLVNRLGIPLNPYMIKTFNAHYSDNDSATEKTMLIFDYIYNRLTSRGISSRFNDVRFKMSNTSQSSGVKGVTVHGNDIIASDEACKYITLGNDIVSFKTTSVYQGATVNVHFSLRGKDFDKLKIVILDNKSEVFKRDVMYLMQEEYILMCKDGIKDIDKTRMRLEPIYQSFIAARS